MKGQRRSQGGISLSSDIMAWTVDAAELENITPARARDLLVECFFAAQNEAYARTSHEKHAEIGRVEIKKTVESLIRMKFKELGHDWDCPTADGFRQVALSLAVEAACWGTSPETIERSMAELRKVQQQLMS